MVKAGSITAIAFLIIGGILFFSANGIDRVKAFGEALKPTNGSRSGSPSIPTAQRNLATNQSAGVALANTEDTVITGGSIASKRKNAPVITQRLEVQSSLLPEIRKSSDIRNVNGTIIVGQPTEKLKRQLTGIGTAQTSLGSVAVLTEAKRAEVRSRALTEVQQEDVRRLEARRQSAIDRGINPNVKLSGAELVLRKAEQEEISKNILTDRFGGQVFVNGKLFAKPGFATGGGAVRNNAPTIDKQGNIKVQESGATVRARNLATLESALAFNRRVIEAKKAGLPVPTQ